MVALPDLPPSAVCGRKGSVLRFILKDWLLPANVSLRAVPKADLFTEAKRFLSDENVFVVVTKDDALVRVAILDNITHVSAHFSSANLRG